MYPSERSHSIACATDEGKGLRRRRMMTVKKKRPVSVTCERSIKSTCLPRPSMASSSIAGDTVYDFWEAVTCAKCHLRFVPDSGGPPLVPFWITECGHILCNSHISGYIDNRSSFGPALISNGLEDADQSCSHCGDRPINLAPLQREVSNDQRTARIFVWLLTCADGTANKRLVQVTSLRNRFIRKLCQGSLFIPIEEVDVSHHVCTVPASDNGVAHQILQRKDSQAAFYYRAM